MRSTTFTLPAAVVVVLAGVLLLRPVSGPSCWKKQERERNSSVLIPSPPEVEAIQRRCLIKRDLARRIIAERLPLLQAAELFREVNGEDGLHTLALTGLDRSINELLCRQVIEYLATEEREMEQAGCVWTGTRWSEELRQDFDRRMAAGEFPPPAARE